MIKKLPKSKIEIEREIAWKDWENYINQAVAEISEEFKFPGFRPGKAPRNLVEQRVGKEMILNNAAEKAIRKDYVDFVVKEKIETIGNPEVEIKKIEEGNELVYSAKVDVMPEVELKDEYREKIKKINQEYEDKTPEADEEELKLELERLANSRAKLVTVNREAKNGDAVVVDFFVSVGGAVIEGGTSKDHSLIIGKGVFIPGFEENIIGMKLDDEKEFELNFPKDYHKKDLAGVLATFKVKMKLVQERQIPELNDEFAKSLGKFENLEALKNNMRDGMKHENEHKIKEEKNAKFVEAMVSNLEGEIPEALIAQELDKMLHEFEYQIQSMQMNLDDYFSKIGKTKKDIEKEWEPQAIKRVKSALALREVAKKEEVKAASEEVEAEMNKTLQYYKNVKDFEKNIDMERLYNYSKSILENEKVFEMLEKM